MWEVLVPPIAIPRSTCVRPGSLLLLRSLTIRGTCPVSTLFTGALALRLPGPTQVANENDGWLQTKIDGITGKGEF